MNISPLLAFLPTFTFLVLQIGEFLLPCIPQKKCYHREDWLLNLLGLFIQGCLVPILSIVLSYKIFPLLLPNAKGTLPITVWQAFCLNFVVIDFLYYWQHRALHQIKYLWPFHLCHHSSPKVDIWATSRNNLWINFMFVYLLINPMLGYCCAEPTGFFAGVMMTASLDIFRHTQINLNTVKHHIWYKWLSYFMVMPAMHRAHHDITSRNGNFAANLILWDRIFGTFKAPQQTIVNYQPKTVQSLSKQFLYPLK